MGTGYLSGSAGIYYRFTFLMLTVNCFTCKLLFVGPFVVSEVFWDVGIHFLQGSVFVEHVQGEVGFWWDPKIAGLGN